MISSVENPLLPFAPVLRGEGQRCEVFCARKRLVFMHHARIDFGEIDLRRPISPKSALRNASQRWEKGRNVPSRVLTLRS